MLAGAAGGAGGRGCKQEASKETRRFVIALAQCLAVPCRALPFVVVKSRADEPDAMVVDI